MTECVRYLLPTHTGPYINVANHRIRDNPRENAWASCMQFSYVYFAKAGETIINDCMYVYGAGYARSART